MDYDKNEKEEVDIQDISPDFLQSLFDLKVTPGILKTVDGKKIPIKQERLQPKETYTLLTSKSEKKKKLSMNYIFRNDFEMLVQHSRKKFTISTKAHFICRF